MVRALWTRGAGNKEHSVEAHSALRHDNLIAVLVVAFAQGAETHKTAGDAVGFFQIKRPYHSLARGQF
jgi:hypothetical protein